MWTAPGNALHVHLHLQDSNHYNLLEQKSYLSYIIAGLCASIQPSMLDFAPYVACYQRYQYPDHNTPTTISWGYNNRTTAIRVINNHIEHRVPCANSDPQVVIKKILEGAYEGISHKKHPIAPVYGIASQTKYNLQPLAMTLTEAKRYYNKY